MEQFLYSIDPITLWTAIIALATFVYMLASILILIATKKQSQLTEKQLLLNKTIFETFHRPYVAPTNFNTERSENGQINITIEVNNSGPLPAINLICDWAIFLNNIKQSQFPNVHQPSTLLPSSKIYLSASFAKNIAQQIDLRSSIMEIVINLSYQGLNEQIYTTYHKTKYDPLLNGYIPIETKLS